MLRQDFEPAGYEIRFIDLLDLDAVRRALSGAGLVIAETITNPLCGVPDIEAIGAAARERGVPFLVDNTFATPLLARPLDLGATAVMHSATKYLGGHSDLVAGVIVGDARTMGVARARSARTGTPLGPFDAWLGLRGLRTLDVRIRRHSENSLVLARAMHSMPGVARVHHPLLEDSPSFGVARRLLPHGSGGMMAFDLDGNLFVTLPGKPKRPEDPPKDKILLPANQILKVDKSGTWTMLIDDPASEKLDHPTNCAFGGPGLQDLYFANLEGEHFSRVHTTFHGHPLYHQR